MVGRAKLIRTTGSPLIGGSLRRVTPPWVGWLAGCGAAVVVSAVLARFGGLFATRMWVVVAIALAAGVAGSRVGDAVADAMCDDWGWVVDGVFGGICSAVAWFLGVLLTSGMR